MAFKDIFEETRRKLGGFLGNQADNFRVGMNVTKNQITPFANNAINKVPQQIRRPVSQMIQTRQTPLRFAVNQGIKNISSAVRDPRFGSSELSTTKALYGALPNQKPLSPNLRRALDFKPNIQSPAVKKIVNTAGNAVASMNPVTNIASRIARPNYFKAVQGGMNTAVGFMKPLAGSSQEFDEYSKVLRIPVSQRTPEQQKLAIQAGQNATLQLAGFADAPRVSKFKGKMVQTEKGAPFQEVGNAKASMSPEERTLGMFNSLSDKAEPKMLSQQEADDLANTALYRATEQKKRFNQIFDKFVAGKEVAKTTGAETTLKYNVPFKKAKETLSQLENSGEKNKYAVNIRKAYDDLFKVAEDLGKQTKQQIKYRQEYLTHVWDNTPQQIEQAFQRLGKKFSFGDPREFASYEEGIAAGLKPKYTNPAQMLGEYSQKIESTKANLDFFNSLRDEGFIVPASVGARHSEFVPINAEGFPQNTTSFNSEIRTGEWYAPKEVANEINKLFSPQDYGTVGKVAEVGAKISGGAQDLLLSGGIPKTPINAFTIAQTTKEMLSGRVKSPLVSMFKSLDRGMAQKFFTDNVPTIKKMQERNVPFNADFDIQNLADQGWLRNTFGKGFGGVWSKTVNEPTFKRFMPMLQVNLFNDIEKGAIKGGKTAQEAADIAAQAVKNFYGLTSTGTTARRSQLGKDLTSAFLFAPRYRESMINFWINNVKSLYKNPSKSGTRTNAKFLVGATATLIVMDQLNKAINGHGMGENPDGKTDKLLIPLGNGKTIGIPFLSSIATIPRSMYSFGKNVYEGDFKGATKDVTSNLSMALKPLGEVVSNENYFGSEIYDDNDTAGDKLKKSANYLFNPVTGAYTHPYLREGVKFAQGKQGVTETLSKATEAPIRWYNTESIKNAPFWEEYANQKKVADIVSNAKYGKISQESAEKQIKSLTGGKAVPDGTVIENNEKGYVAYKTSKGIEFADTPEEANLAIAKDEFKNSDKKSELKDGTYFYKKSDGDVGTYTEKEYNSKIREQRLSILEENKNYSEWSKLAEEQLTDIQEQMKDADPLTAMELENKWIDLAQKAEKYKSYGGFTKGKKAKKFTAIDLSPTVSKIPVRSAKKPVFKQISAPKIAIKTSRPKLISKSTLANIR